MRLRRPACRSARWGCLSLVDQVHEADQRGGEAGRFGVGQADAGVGLVHELEAAYFFGVGVRESVGHFCIMAQARRE